MSLYALMCLNSLVEIHVKTQVIKNKPKFSFTFFCVNPYGLLVVRSEFTVKLL